MLYYPGHIWVIFQVSGSMLIGQCVTHFNNFDPVSTLLPIEYLCTNLMMFTTGTSPMTRRTAALSRGGVRHQFTVVANCDNNDSGARRKVRYRVR